MKQIGLGALAYSNDNSEFIIRAYLDSTTNGRWEVQMLRRGYLGRVEPAYNYYDVYKKPLLYCSPVAKVLVRTDYPTYAMTSYFPPIGWSGSVWRKINKTVPGMLLFVEQNYRGIMADRTVPDGNSSGNFCGISNVHSYGTNALYVDGHVTFYKKNVLISDRKLWSGE